MHFIAAGPKYNGCPPSHSLISQLAFPPLTPSDMTFFRPAQSVRFLTLGGIRSALLAPSVRFLTLGGIESVHFMVAGPKYPGCPPSHSLILYTVPLRSGFPFCTGGRGSLAQRFAWQLFMAVP